MAKKLRQVQNKLYKFENDFTVYGSWDNPYFVARDIGKWLGYVDIYTVLKDFVDSEDLIKAVVYYNGAYREVLLVSEFGLYEILMRSKKPLAIKFRKQVKQELKKIRLTGGTVIQGREEDFIMNNFHSFSDEVKRQMIQELKNKNRNLLIIGGF